MSSVRPARCSSFLVATTSPMTPGDLHYSLISTVSTMPTIAASTGQSLRPEAMRGSAMTTSTVSLVRRVAGTADRDEIASFSLAARIDRADHHQLVADEARVFGRDDGSYTILARAPHPAPGTAPGTRHPHSTQHLAIQHSTLSLRRRSRLPIGRTSSRLLRSGSRVRTPARRPSCGAGKPVAATAATSPRTMAVTYPAPISLPAHRRGLPPPSPSRRSGLNHRHKALGRSF